MPEYGAIDLEIQGQVATIKILGHEEAAERAKAGKGTPGGRHREMATPWPGPNASATRWLPSS